jgi:hypothetical protein
MLKIIIDLIIVLSLILAFVTGTIAIFSKKNRKQDVKVALIALVIWLFASCMSALIS